MDQGKKVVFSLGQGEVTVRPMSKGEFVVLKYTGPERMNVDCMGANQVRLTTSPIPAETCPFLGHEEACGVLSEEGNTRMCGWEKGSDRGECPLRAQKEQRSCT